jgi:hypothetical protein
VYQSKSRENLGWTASIKSYSVWIQFTLVIVCKIFHFLRSLYQFHSS